MSDLICGLCNEWRVCSLHNAISWSSGYDVQERQHLRVRYTSIVRRFREVLAVIGWAAAHCPDCKAVWVGSENPRHERWCLYRFTWAFKRGAVWI